MSCGIAIAAALLLSDPHVAMAAAEPAAVAGAPISIASEPLFADIVSRAGALRVVVDGWNGVPVDFDAFKTRAHELAALDMQGHVTLKARGTDGDLKCILRGISEDLSLKLTAIETAADAAARATALSELSYLLNDNVEVITTPPQHDAQSGVATD